MSTAALIKIAVLLVSLAVAIFVSLRRRFRAAANRRAMQELRLRALQEVPDDLDPAIGADQPYAVMMEIGVPSGAASILSSIFGDASIYHTTGAGLLGGIGHENVRQAASAFVEESGRHRDHMTPTTNYTYPSDGNVRFYIRTRNGVYVTADRSEYSLGAKSDPLWPLFYAGQEVIRQFRLVAPDFGR